MKKIELKLVEGEFRYSSKNQFTKPLDFCNLFGSIKDHVNETAIVVYLNSELDGFYDVHSTGNSASTSYDMHDLFGRAYMLRARYVVMIHNHPRGDPTPSPIDRRIMAQIMLHAEPLHKLSLLDFIIIGDGAYWSMFEDNEGDDYRNGSIRLCKPLKKQ